MESTNIGQVTGEGVQVRRPYQTPQLMNLGGIQTIVQADLTVSAFDATFCQATGAAS